jgi:hypothetical protein
VVRIQLSDATLTDELVDFFRRRECRAERVDRDVIEIEAHPTLGREQARMELDLLLRVWASLHPGVDLRTKSTGGPPGNERTARAVARRSAGTNPGLRLPAD